MYQFREVANREGRLRPGIVKKSKIGLSSGTPAPRLRFEESIDELVG
jgi:hypothetical protein